MRILVTGSSGLIGRALVARQHSDGMEFRNYDIVEGSDICDPAQLRRALAGCDGILHLAAVSRVAWGEADPALCRHVNVAGTRFVLEAALAQRAPPWVVFASSREVYGDPKVMPVVEDAALRPVNTYGQTKAEGEDLVQAARTHGLRCAIVRLSSVYGTIHDHPDRAIPSLLWRAMQGQDLRLSGADAFFDFVHVDDTVRGLMLAAQQLASGAGQVPTVHLATGVATSLVTLAREAIGVAGSKSPLTLLPKRSFDVSGFVGDPARAMAVLGWAAAIGLNAGLRGLHRDLLDRNCAPDPVAMPRAAALVADR